MKERLKRRVRHWAIRQGLIDPKDLKEIREVFKFPVSERPAKSINRLPFMQKIL